MSLREPQYVQLQSILAFLWAYMRQSRALLAVVEEPGAILAEVGIHKPWREDGSKIIFETEMPFLGCYESGPAKSTSEGQRGELVPITLMFVDRLDVGGENLLPEAWGSAWSKMVSWVAQTGIAGAKVNLPDGSIDLCTDGQIGRLVWKSTDQFCGDGICGFEAQLEMYHDLPPWAPITNALLREILLTTTMGSGPSAEATIAIDQTPEVG